MKTMTLLFLVFLLTGCATYDYVTYRRSPLMVSQEYRKYLGTAGGKYIEEIGRIIYEHAQKTIELDVPFDGWRGEILVEFRIASDGKVADVRIISEKVKGEHYDSEKILFHARSVGPFPAFPADLREKEKELRFKITYDFKESQDASNY